MGRRKIEIRAIKDDRNRSVTFLKRKGGLFKKAHELSVLCSVDVAVIIFGHNKKLYEFSSGDIGDTIRKCQYYGPPHEHKGPNDFKNKGGGGGDDDDDDDDDVDESFQKREDSIPPGPPHQAHLHHQQGPPPTSMATAHHQQQQGLMPPHMQHHNSFQHVRQPAASASPPMHNGMFQPRHSTPQPAGIMSRSNSRAEIRRPASTIVPMQQAQHPPPPQPQNGYAYMPNPPIYNPQAAGQSGGPTPPQPSPRPQFQQFQPPAPQQQQQQQPPHTHAHQQQQQQQQQQAPQHPQPPPHPNSQPLNQKPFQNVQQAHHQFLEDHRRHSQPPPVDSLHPPAQPLPRSSPQPEQQQQQHLRPPTPPDRRHSSSKSQSIFTPIDEGGSVLARVFFGGPDPPRRDDNKESPTEIKPPPRSTSQPSTHLNRLEAVPQQRAATTTSASREFSVPQRSDTNGSKGAIRPKLNLTIPSESEENDSGSGSRGASGNRSANPERSHNGAILPPPSPSASALCSAGATGPPNPFARPPPPMSQQNSTAYSENRSNTGNNLETPISALPSRYMEQSLIASPAGLFSDWDSWGRTSMNSAILPSPLNFPTPADAKPPILFGGKGEGSGEEKRKAEDSASGDGKRMKV